MSRACEFTAHIAETQRDHALEHAFTRERGTP